MTSSGTADQFVEELGKGIGKRVENVRHSLEETRPEDVVAGMESLVRNNPVPILVGALAAGFFIGLALGNQEQ